MGNRFNNHTQTQLRPPVCRPGPPPPPPPGVATSCCVGTLVPLTVTMTTSGSTCAALNGINVTLTNLTPPGPKWSGSFHPAWSPLDTISIEFECVQTSPGVWKWRLRWIDWCSTPVDRFANAGGTCSPLSQVFAMRNQLCAQPPTCGGGAQRNFTATVH